MMNLQHRDIEVLGTTLFALIDTDSGISLLCYATLLLLTLESGAKIFSGIGGQTITTLGYVC